jgi:mannitol-specific phosphotransferase system IIBC component
MIKNIFNSKITSAASGEFIVIGLKLTDTQAHVLRLTGIALAALSLTVLAIGLAMHAQHEAAAKNLASAKHTHKARRSHASRAN